MSSCKKCGKPIEFVRNDNGKFVPVDINTKRNHFKSCRPKRVAAPEPLQNMLLI